ncbi:PTS fructose transporter subunit IIA [[Eubacterium] hominis]|uniref:PTS sugar transporter subunit IIA domain-containing protein n=1 Tax=[Eubacterium] hominis TaxID=2764325 RepID=UPI003A4D4704
MIGLLVTGHGNFGSGLTSSVNLIAGEQENYKYVDFLPEYSVEDLERELTKAMDELKDCEGILVLSDLAGGSPFKTAVEVGFPRGNVAVIGGSNLPMLVEVSMTRKFMTDLDVFALAESAINTGKDQIVRYEFKAVEQEIPEDGI